MINFIFFYFHTNSTESPRYNGEIFTKKLCNKKESQEKQLSSLLPFYSCRYCRLFYFKGHPHRCEGQRLLQSPKSETQERTCTAFSVQVMPSLRGTSCSLTATRIHAKFYSTDCGTCHNCLSNLSTQLITDTLFSILNLPPLHYTALKNSCQSNF